MYPVKTIQNLEKLNECPVFNINHFLWNNVYKPKSYGRMAYLDKIGVIVHMTAIEKIPYEYILRKMIRFIKIVHWRCLLTFLPKIIKNI